MIGLRKYLPKKKLVENFSYVSLLEVFSLLAPFITYPYLVRVIGIDLYGVVILAQVLASYASLIIDFGSNKVCAKFVSENKDDKSKLSEILCSVLCTRSLLWIICLVVYLIIVYIVPAYREHWLLFFISYFLTAIDVLFPQFFFQGIEKMKVTSLLNIGIKLFFIGTVFVVVHSPEDYIFVPLLYAIGYSIAGMVSLSIIFFKMKIRFYVPSIKKILFYVKESLPLFFTDFMVTIKGKLSYIFIGGFVSTSDVVVYDLGYKLSNVIGKPTQIISVVMFPRFARSKNVHKLKIATLFTFTIITILVIILNLFLPMIVPLFIDRQVDLLPLRILSLVPIFHSVGMMISQNFFVAFGYNKYLLYSIIISISAYVIALSVLFFSYKTLSLYSFVIVDMVFYITDITYKLIKSKRIMSHHLK